MTEENIPLDGRTIDINSPLGNVLTDYWGDEMTEVYKYHTSNCASNCASSEVKE